mmetsp:Transcript_75523/g.218134  ORF Transcript_75523/g.218134 Transcript_75523/m.218134 type:complete len:223 (-) Transcript_75523:1460-2128(-)
MRCLIVQLLLGLRGRQLKLCQVLEDFFLPQDGIDQHRVALELVLDDVVDHLDQEHEPMVRERRPEQVARPRATLDQAEELEATLGRENLDVGGDVAQDRQQHLHQRVVLLLWQALRDHLVQGERNQVRMRSLERRDAQRDLSLETLVQPHRERPLRGQDEQHEGRGVQQAHQVWRVLRLLQQVQDRQDNGIRVQVLYDSLGKAGVQSQQVPEQHKGFLEVMH